ncbi:MAG: hypothetical protein INH41_06640 [Myxococcaceae bacterium]|jgi:hypothetical protein|nr:hypothetical protein [Myxococcaceae bacterium]
MTALPQRDVQRLERLFDQQMWAFGRDATRAQGNLLALRGFTRTPPPSGRDVSGTYRLEERGLGVELSSVGVRGCVGGREVFLDRDPMAKQVPRLDGVALSALLAWFADYEGWVQAAVGPAWRAASLEARSRPPAFPAAQMQGLWRALAEQVEGGSRR